MTAITWLCALLLGVAALLAVSRIVRGPSVLDRSLASDVLLAVLVCALGVEAVVNDHSTTLPVLVSLSLVGFAGAAAVARYLGGERQEGRR